MIDMLKKNKVSLVLQSSNEHVNNWNGKFEHYNSISYENKNEKNHYSEIKREQVLEINVPRRRTIN